MKHAIVQADARSLPLADGSVDLTVTSPPYCDARTYGIGAQRKCVEWVTWMLDVVTELQRVTIGPVIIVAAGVTRDRNYWPACEGLMWEWWKRGGDCQLYRPVYWHRVGIPGSGGKDWFRADVEYCMCFKRPGQLPWSDNTACGHPPKWAPGGSMSNRLSSGARVNQWGHPIDSGGTGGSIDDVTCGKARPSHRLTGAEKLTMGARSHTKRIANEQGNGDAMCDQVYLPPTKANPGNVLKVNVGGGVLGHPFAHENEAPYPVALVEFFIKSLCPPGGRVLDPFCGSGTTADAAERTGRNSIMCDLRASQCELTRRRLKTPNARRTKKSKAVKGEVTLFGVEAA
jgi:hypothetical protein